MSHTSTRTLHPTIRQLAALGYGSGDRIWVRLLLPKNLPLEIALQRGMAFETPEGKLAPIPIDGYLSWRSDGMRFTRIIRSKGTEKIFKNGLLKLQQFNAQGYGVYFVVNPGGREDHEITQCRSLFYECDDIGKDEQWKRLQLLEESYLGHRASVVAETSKSLHCYFRLNEAIEPGEWRTLQQRLIQQQDSDQSIHNPSRLMRLAGFDHWRWTGEKLESTPVRLIQVENSSFSVAEFDHVLPAWDESQWKGKRGDRPYVASEATDDGWDIRNFASFLEGYSPKGRRGWITCKCPVHGGESDNSLHIEVGSGAFKCHAGCDSKEVYHAALQLAQARGYVLPSGNGSGKQGKKSLPPDYSLNFKPDVISKTKYLGSIAIPDKAKLIVLRAPKGSGKTELLAHQVGTAIENGSRRVWVITYREQLGMQLANRFGLAYKTEIWERPEGRMFGFALCVDSLHPKCESRFTAQGTEDDWVIIDECESVVWHMLDSSTCVDHRLEILKQFDWLVYGVLNPRTKGKLFLADADASDLTVDFIRKLAEQPDLEPFVIRSDYKPEKGWVVHDYEKATDLWVTLSRQVQTGKHLVLTTGQRVDSKWGTQTIEAAIKEECPGKRVLRIDRDTIANPEHPAYGLMQHSDMGSVLKNYDVILASPTIESGVSIDLYGHFDAVWCFATGAIPESSVRQFLARLRDVNVPRHLYAAAQGIPSAFVGNREIDPAALLTTENKKVRANLHRLQGSGINIDIDGSVQSNLIAFETWGKLGARVNRGLAHYHDAIVAGLKAEGHTVVPADTCLDKEASKAVSEAMGGTRDANHEAEAKAVSEALDISDKEYEELQQKRSKTDDERRQLRKYETHQKYRVEVTPSLVLKDDGGWHPYIRTHYYLTVGADYLKTRDSARFQGIANEQGKAWIPDVNKKLISSKVLALRILGIPEVLTIASAGEELHSSHPVIEAVATKARQASVDVKDFLGVEVSDRMSNIAIVQELLAQAIGFRLEKIGQKTIGKKRTWIYTYPDAKKYAGIAPYDGRSEVIQAWLRHDQEKTAKEDPRLTCETTNIEDPLTRNDSEKHTKTLYINKGTSCAGVQVCSVQCAEKSEATTEGVAVVRPEEIALTLIGAATDEELKGAIEQFSVLPYEIKQSAWKLLKGHPVVRQRVRVLTQLEAC